MKNKKSPTNVKGHDFDKDTLLSIYSTLNSTQLDYNERKWETLRIASTLSVGILAAIGGLVASNIIEDGLMIGCLGVFLMIIGLFIYRWLIGNIEREASLQYFTEFSMYQIEKLLGLHKEIPEKFRWFPHSGFMFDKKHVDYQYKADIDLRDKELEIDPIQVWVKGRIKNHELIKIVKYFAMILLSTYLVIGFALIVTAIMPITK